MMDENPVSQLILGILLGYPPKSNIDTKNDVFFNVSPASNMVILGIHVSFRGCIPFLLSCARWIPPKSK